MGSNGVVGEEAGAEAAALRVIERYLALRISSVDDWRVEVDEMTPSVGVGLQSRSTAVIIECAEILAGRWEYERYSR